MARKVLGDGKLPLDEGLPRCYIRLHCHKKIFLLRDNVCYEGENNIMKKITTKQLVFISVLAAIYVVLSIISFGTNDFKVSIESLAVITGSTVLGPVGGFFVGLVGELIHQLIGPYGVDITLPLWLLPYALEGLMFGLLVKKEHGNISKKRLILTIIPCEICLTVMVTLVNWASAVIQGWGAWQVIAAAIPLRLGIMAVRIVVYIIVLPLLYSRIKKVI